MKIIVLAALAAVTCFSSTADAGQRVNSYFRRDGTYVAPYYRSAPNSTTYDNYSTRGNVNPYTGQLGTVDPQPFQPPRQRSCYINSYGQYVCQ